MIKIAHLGTNREMFTWKREVFPNSRTETKVAAPNNSFKPSPLRGLGAGSYDSAIAVAATLPGLTQALCAARQRAPDLAFGGALTGLFRGV